MSGTTIPAVPPQFFDNNGEPAAGHQLFSYAAGSTTKQNTYNDADLAPGHVNTNPIVLDSAGRATIFLDALSYKFVLASPTDSDPPASPIWTRDNILSIPEISGNVDVLGTFGENVTAGQVVYISDGSGGKTAGYWYKAKADNDYSSSAANSVGISLATVTANDIGIIRIVGRVTNQSGLTPGTLYYVSTATAGALQSSAPISNARAVLFSDTATSGIVVALPGTAVTTTTLANVRSPNLIANDIFYLWSVTSNPDYWETSGTAPTLSRDTGTTKRGIYSCKIVPGAGTGQVRQPFFALPGTFAGNRSYSAGMWVHCAVASAIRIGLYNGSSTTYSTYHTGGGGWEWLSLSTSFSSGSYIYLLVEVISTAGSCYVAGAVAVLSSTIPEDWFPAPTTVKKLVFNTRGNITLTTAASPSYIYQADRPGMVIAARAYNAVTGGTQATTIQIDRFPLDGVSSGGTGLVTLSIGVGGFSDSENAVASFAYPYKCLAGPEDATHDGYGLAIYVSQVGNTPTPAGLAVVISLLEYERGQEYNYNSIPL